MTEGFSVTPSPHTGLMLSKEFEPRVMRMSASRIKTWMGCSLQAKFKYVDKEPVDYDGAKAVFGKCVHAGLEYYNNSGGDVDTAVRVFLNYWFNPEKVGSPNNRIRWPKHHGYTFGSLKNRGIQIIEWMHENQRWDDREVLATEHPFVVPLGPYELTGFVDLVELRQTGKGRTILKIIDYKAQPITTSTLTPQGWRKLGDLTVGDHVIGPDGKPTEILGVFPQGVLDCVELEFSNGDRVRCSPDHYWTFTDFVDGQTKTLTVNELGPLKKGNNYRFRVGTVDPVDFFPPIPAPVDPYILGVLIGDGSLTSLQSRFTKPDPSLWEQVRRRLPTDHRLVVEHFARGECRIAAPRGKNVFLNYIAEVGLNVRSTDRFIPDNLQRMSIEDRWELLAGLMDTDGSESAGVRIGKNDRPRVRFDTSSEQLKNDVIELMSGLGGVPHVNTTVKPHYTTSDGGRVYSTHASHHLTFSSDVNPHRAASRRDRWQPPRQTVDRRLVHIREVLPEEMLCIKVAHPSGLYVTENMVLTHNTSSWQPNKAELSLDMQFTIYDFASRQKEFWTGWPLPDGTIDPKFPGMANGEWLWELHKTTPRRSIWFHLWNPKEIDCGERDDTDFGRLFRVCQEIDRAEQLQVFVPKVGDACLFCLTGDTEIVTRDGIRLIRDLVGLDPQVLTTNSRGSGTWQQAPIRSFGVQPTWAITFKRGRARKTVRATAEHLWPVRDYAHSALTMRPTSALQAGTRVAMCHGPTRSKVRRSPYGVAHGIVFGDGQLERGSAAVVLHGEKEQLLKWFPLSPTTTIQTPTGAATRVADLPRAYKTPPSLQEARSYLYGWLAGYFATDGHITEQGQATISSARHRNLELVRDVCFILGIGTYQVTTEMRIGTGSTETPLYRIQLMTNTLDEGFFLREMHRLRLRTVAPRDVWKVESVTPTGECEEVFCATVEGSHVFTLADGLVTGNCDFTEICPTQPTVKTAAEFKEEDTAWI